MSKTQSKFGVTIPKIPELINVTYTEITALIGSNTLVPGQKYLITDYQTVHTIPTTVDTNTGPIEPLIVTALSVNELEPIAYSTLHPEDIIYYDVNNNLTRVPGCTKGHILRRIDTLNKNDIASDWRYIKYRRYALNVTSVYAGGTTYAKGAVVVDGSTTAIYISMVSSNTGNALSDKTKWLTSSMLINGEYISPTLTNYSIGIGNIPVDNLDFNDYTMFESDTLLKNNTFKSAPDYLLTCNTVFRNYLDSNVISCQENDALLVNTNIVKQFVGMDVTTTSSTIVDAQNVKGGSIASSNILRLAHVKLNGPSIQRLMCENEIQHCVFNEIFVDNIINAPAVSSNRFSGNVINSYVSNLSLVGGMKNNIINAYVSSGVDLTSATHIYENYNKTWMTSSTLADKLQYLDGSDIIQTVAINA